MSTTLRRTLFAAALVTAVGALLLSGGSRAVLLVVAALVLGLAFALRAKQSTRSEADPAPIAAASPPHQRRVWGRKARLLVELQAQLEQTLENLAEQERQVRELTRKREAQESSARALQTTLEARVIELEGARRAEREALDRQRVQHQQELTRLKQSLDDYRRELAALEAAVEATLNRPTTSRPSTPPEATPLLQVGRPQSIL